MGALTWDLKEALPFALLLAFGLKGSTPYRYYPMRLSRARPKPKQQGYILSYIDISSRLIIKALAILSVLNSTGSRIWPGKPYEKSKPSEGIAWHLAKGRK